MEDDFNIREIFRKNLYYFLVAIISTVSVIVFPILGAAGTDVSHAIKDNFPTDSLGWTIWIIIRAMIVLMNLLIFTSFVQQSKVNIKDNKKYIEANEILGKCKNKEYIPRSPKKYMYSIYLTKGITLLITTIASLFAIGNAILNYDYMLLIASVFTVVNSIVFGIMSMKKTELYYTTEYYDYAKYQENLYINKENEDVKI